MEPVVLAEDVRRRYGDTEALSGVSIELAAGEVFGLVGPNGAGKTTLVRTLTGTTTAEGTVRLFGEPPGEIDRSLLGLLPQDFDPHDRLTPRELVAYYAALYDEARDVDAVLEDVGMAGDADRYYENLSGGQRRRTCVATALVNDPDLIVLDEPTTGIDPAGRRALWELLEGLADRGVTILVTTHYMEEAQQLADRVGLLADGELVACDTPSALIGAHGGEPRLTVAGEFDDAVADLFEYPAERVEEGLVIHGVAPEDIGGVVATLEEAGGSYETLSWSEPDLEDVYLSLTGQRVAVAEDAPLTAADGGER
ncbi:MAG: ABC transporter ATP-binding protein [Haloarculaceae archaeon]